MMSEEKTVPQVEKLTGGLTSLEDRIQPDPAWKLARIAQAREWISRLCADRMAWRMTVPVQREDADMVLGDACTIAEAALAENAMLRRTLQAIARDDRPADDEPHGWEAVAKVKRDYARNALAGDLDEPDSDS